MFQIKSVSEDITIKECTSLQECKKWFQNMCNIPWNWYVLTSESKKLIGNSYESW